MRWERRAFPPLFFFFLPSFLYWLMMIHRCTSLYTSTLTSRDLVSHLWPVSFLFPPPSILLLLLLFAPTGKKFSFKFRLATTLIELNNRRWRRSRRWARRCKKGRKACPSGGGGRWWWWPTSRLTREGRRRRTKFNGVMHNTAKNHFFCVYTRASSLLLWSSRFFFSLLKEREFLCF